MTERCLASGGGEAEETGHSEESGVEGGGGEWSEGGELGVGVGRGGTAPPFAPPAVRLAGAPIMRAAASCAAADASAA